MSKPPSRSASTSASASRPASTPTSTSAPDPATPAGSTTSAAHDEAPLVRRVFAFAIDYAVLVLWGGVLFALSPLLPGTWFDDPVRAQLTGFLLLTLPVVLYFAVGESASWQGTPGKRALGVVVGGAGSESHAGAAARAGAATSDPTQTDATQGQNAIPVGARVADRLTFPTALLRNAVKFLPWELAHTFVWRMETWAEPVTLGGSSAAMVLMLFFAAPMLTDPQRRAVWDRAAGTIVRRRR